MVYDHQEKIDNDVFVLGLIIGKNVLINHSEPKCLYLIYVYGIDQWFSIFLYLLTTHTV